MSAAKFWIALIMAFAQFVHLYFDIDLGLDQETVTVVVSGLAALLVYAVPNKSAK
jgi:hypothetical protein